MKSLKSTAATLAAIALVGCIALIGCKNRKEEPIPGPKADSPPAAGSIILPAPSATPPSTPASDSPSHSGSSGARRHGTPGISWFQGTVEEAYSTTCAKCTAMFWH